MQARYLIPFSLVAGLAVSPLLWADKFDPHLNLPRILSQAEGIQVYTLPDGRVHAEIHYQEQGDAQSGDDTRHKFSFEGTRAEVREQIQQNTTLPGDKKQALLQALSGNAVSLFSQPLFGGDNPFDDPFFKGGPFAGNDPFMDDFFRNSPFNEDFLKKFLGEWPSLKPPPPIPGLGSGYTVPQIQPPANQPPVQIIPRAMPPDTQPNTSPGDGNSKGILL